MASDCRRLTEVRRLEVSASVQEFLRGLHAAFPGYVNEAAGRVRIDDGTAAMEIPLAPGPPRVIASLSLPTLCVTIRFTAGPPPGRQVCLRIWITPCPGVAVDVLHLP
jgi:hypothetical protein